MENLGVHTGSHLTLAETYMSETLLMTDFKNSTAAEHFWQVTEVLGPEMVNLTAR